MPTTGKHRATLTFTNPVWLKIVSRWGSEQEWKAWVKQQTLAAIKPPPPPPGSYAPRIEERF